MNYEKIYYLIVNNAKNRNIRSNTYVEKHHIIPKCIGGQDTLDNLVLLTLREHFICHKLLVYMYPNNKSIKCALWIICTTTLSAKHEYIKNEILYKLENIPANIRVSHFLNTIEKHINITSRDYEYCRMLYYEASKNKKRDNEQRQRISEATKKAMQDPSRIVKRRKGVLGSKHYYNIKTLERFKWFPGDPDIDLSIYKWGRPSVKKNQLIS